MSPAEKEHDAWLLKQAAAYLGQCAPQLLFKKIMRRTVGGITHMCVLQIEMPGVLRVYDLASGKLLTESTPGQLDRLARRYTSRTTREQS